MSNTVEVIRTAIEAQLLEIQIKHVLVLMERGHSRDEAVSLVLQHSPPVDDIADNIEQLAAAIDADRQTIN